MTDPKTINNSGGKATTEDYHNRTGRGYHGLPTFPLWDWPVLWSTICINLLALALPIVTLQTYDRIIPYQSQNTLVILGLGLIATLFIDAILRCARSWVTGWAGARFEHRLSEKAVSHLLSAPLHEVEKTAAGEHLDRFNAIDQVRDFYAGQGPTIAVDLPFALLFVGLIAFIGGWLVLVPIVLFIAFALAALVSGKLLRKALARRAQSDDIRYNFLIEVLSGAHTIKGLGMEPAMIRRYERLMDGAANTAYETALVSGVNQGLSGIFSQMATLFIVMFGAVGVVNGDMTMGTLSACMILGGRSLQPVLRALGIWTHFQQIRIGKERINRIYALPVEQHGTVTLPEKLQGNVEIKNVAFSYGEETQTPLFTNLNLTVKAGDTVAIRGPNGCGKSTLLGLINGTVRPTKGQVLIDGIDVATLDVQKLRDQIAYLPQNAEIFRGTVLDNLTMFQGAEAIDQALYYSSRLGLDSYFARLPNGLLTQLGANSVNELSGGIQQRISIVRSLIGQKPLILFDEANNGLDFAADDKLRSVMEELTQDRTMIMISFRPSLIRLADRVQDISFGELSQSMTVDEAMRRPISSVQRPVRRRGVV